MSLRFTRECFSTDRKNDHYLPRRGNQWRDARNLTEDTNESTVREKIEFFRSMGLEVNKGGASNDDNNNNFTSKATTQLTFARPSSFPVRIPRSHDDTPYKGSAQKSTSTQIHYDTNDSKDRPVCHDIISLMRECRVMIIGDKCKVCGKGFKCIKDVQFHMRKKHRKRKPRKELVLKIGNEIISRVPIKRKHLKYLDRNYYDLAIDAAAGTPSTCNKEGSTQFVDLDSDCDINDAAVPQLEIDAKDNRLNELKKENSHTIGGYSTEDDDEIQVLLRITRSPGSGPATEINHETPNRTERELLISDAMREFVRMDNEPMEIIEFDDDELENEDSDDCCWLADVHSPNSHLDRVESNCTFHVENEDDYECPLDDIDSQSKENNNSYFNDRNASFKSENLLYNNDVYETDAPFYSDTSRDERKKSRGSTDNISRGQYPNSRLSPLVLIKEEIILDDLY